jgi:3-phenylpropionate/cinnamic acid dioxygenase small subunit
VTKDEIEALTFAYLECLDDLRLAEWPGFFTDACTYRVIPRENFEAGRTLCTIYAESRGMLIDRVTGLTRTQMFAPRYYRRFVSGLRIVGPEGEGVRLRSNILMVQTLVDKPSEIVLAGVAHDVVVRDEGRLRYRERVVVFDSEMLPNSLIYPA